MRNQVQQSEKKIQLTAEAPGDLVAAAFLRGEIAVFVVKIRSQISVFLNYHLVFHLESVPIVLYLDALFVVVFYLDLVPMCDGDRVEQGIHGLDAGGAGGANLVVAVGGAGVAGIKNRLRSITRSVNII